VKALAVFLHNVDEVQNASGLRTLDMFVNTRREDTRLRIDSPVSRAADRWVDEHIERSKTLAFCTSCHVMEKYGKSLHVDDASYLPAAHFQNNRVPRDKACYTCHTDYTLYGGFKSKLRGLRHLYVQYLGKIPEKIVLYNAYNNRNVSTVTAAREASRKSNSQSGRWQTRSDQSNQRSCLSTGCHEVAHRVEILKTQILDRRRKPKSERGTTNDSHIGR